MRYVRHLAPAAMGLALITILTACGQVSANPPSVAPTDAPTPSPTAEPSVEPTAEPMPTTAPSVAPTPKPTATPAPTPIQVVAHDLPMVGRATVDGVNVRTLPSLHAPLISGEAHDLSKVPNIRLAKGDEVFVTLGPVFADGHSWYMVSQTDYGEVYFEGGWVAGEYLARVSDVPVYNPIVVDMHGIGAGTTGSAEVPAGSPLTIDLAATPMPGVEACEIGVTLVRTDGAEVEIAAWSLTDARVLRMQGFEYPDLFQAAAGTATLHVETTDCSFAASITMPQF